MEPLNLIPKQDHEMDFFVKDFEESAFNTMDYYRIHPNPFDRYAYAIRKVMERARDLAILHSCISDEGGRERTKKRFESFVRYEFGERLAAMSKRLEGAEPAREEAIRQKVSELKRRVIQCRKIWEQFAPRDTRSLCQIGTSIGPGAG